MNQDDRNTRQEPFIEPGEENPSELLDRMKAAASKALENAGQGSEAYQQAALEIFLHMRPRFGPANGMLFNERDAMLRELAGKTGFDPDDAPYFDQGLFEEFADGVARLGEIIAGMGFESDLQGAGRAGLGWSPAPGVSLSIIDPTNSVEWKSPYAGTSAGQEEDPIPMGPRVTLFLYPAIPGESLRGMMTRDQPGEPVFFTGSIMAFTLQEPQSYDVSPETVLKPVLERIEKERLFFKPAEKALEALKDELGAEISAEAVNGVIRARVQGEPPKELPKRMPWCAVLFQGFYDGDMIERLLFPGVPLPE